MNENEQQTAHEELTRMVEPEVIKMGVVQRAISIFAAPEALMRNVKAYPVILVPFLLSVIIGFIAFIPSQAVQDITTQEMSIISIERYGVDLFNFSALADEYGDIDTGNVLDVLTMVTAGASIIIMPFLISFIAALVLFILSKIARGQSRFGQLFSMYMHVYVIMALGGLAVSFLISMTGRFLDVTSLAAVVMPNGRIDMFSFNLLSGISVFNIWATVITFIGLKIINEFSAIKAGVIAVIALLLSISITAAIMTSTWWLMDMTMGMVM